MTKFMIVKQVNAGLMARWIVDEDFKLLDTKSDAHELVRALKLQQPAIKRRIVETSE